MEPEKKKKPRLYIPWFSPRQDKEPVEEEDDWIAYVRRNLHRNLDEEVPYPDSEWRFTRPDSPFAAHEKSDEELHYKILDLFYHSDEVDGSNLSVFVQNGIIYLSGTVKSEVEKIRAEQLIRDIPEVWDVVMDVEIGEEKKKGMFQGPLAF